MTKFRAYLLLFAIVASVLLPACGGGASPTATSAPAPTSPAAATKAPSSGTTPAAGAPTTAPAASKIYEYNLSASADFTGPYADVFKDISDGRKVFINYWNDTTGKQIGVKLNLKTFDARYDASVVASSWPGILSGEKPIAMLGTGGPDVAALQQRLPNDKVPMLMSTGGYGYGWLADQWVFQPRPTYVHEFMGFVNWVLSNWKESRPVRIAAVSSEASPAYKDMVGGIQAYTDKVLKPKGKAEFVGVEWVAVQPTDLSSEMKRLSDKNPDYIYIGTNTAMVAATLRGLEQLGKKVPVVMSSHNGITASANALSMKDLEGCYDVYAMGTDLNTSIEAYKIFNDNKAKYDSAKSVWTLNTVQGTMQAVFAARAIERTVKAVGADKLTGEAVYNAMYASEFADKEFLGLLPSMKFTKDAPFATKGLKVRISTVKDGKHIEATPDWVAIPDDIAKW